MNYYSQFGEDEVLESIFALDYRGQCVEVGANDGVHGSTTLRLEQLGWRAILVEPNPTLAEKLRCERQAQVFECAASDRAGRETLHVAEGAPHADGVSLIASDGAEAARRIARYGFTSRPVEVAVRTLDSILEEARATPGVDFISVDVEGHELSVLRGCNLGRWKPRILLVEDNSGCTDRAVPDYLDCNGYVPFLRTGVNDWYAHKEDIALASPEARARYAHAVGRIRRSRVLAAPLRIVKTIPGLLKVARWARGL